MIFRVSEGLSTLLVFCENRFEVEEWIGAGWVDYVVPMLYVHFVLDPMLDIRWLTTAAAGTNTAVYGMLQPYPLRRTYMPSKPFSLLYSPAISFNVHPFVYVELYS